MEKDTKESPAAEVKDAPAVKTAASKAVKKSGKGAYVVVAVVVLLIVAVALRASHRRSVSEKIVESAIKQASGDKVNVSSKDGSVTVTDKNGNGTATISSNQKLPSDFPKNDIPYMSEKSVSLVITNTEEGKKSWSVTTTVAGSASAANDYIIAKAKEMGYTDTTTTGSSTYYMIIMKNTAYDVVVSITSADSSTGTQVSYTVKQN